MIPKLLEILDAKWLIHRDTILSYVPMFISFLNGQNFSLDHINGDKPKKAYAVAFDEDPINPVDSYELSNLEIPENSIAVIPINGVLFSWGTMQIVNYIRQANENPNIISILFTVNSPGGMVFYTDICADAIKNSVKPTVAVVMNMAASAAMWLISATNYRIATSQLDRVGSIGVKTSITDMSILLKEKLGIVITDLYATKSIKKDEEIREFLNNQNQEPIIKDLDFCNEIFHKAIQDNLGIKPDSEVFTGAMFTAQDAIAEGLLNEINTLDYALDYIYKLGLSNKIKQFKFN